MRKVIESYQACIKHAIEEKTALDKCDNQLTDELKSQHDSFVGLYKTYEPQLSNLDNFVKARDLLKLPNQGKTEIF